MKQKKIALYYEYVNKIGGIETWMYNLCIALYKYYDVTLLYKGCDFLQTTRFYPYCTLEQWNAKKEYEFDTVINSSNWREFPKNIKAEKVFTVIHCDYEYANKQLGISPMINPDHKLISVTKYAQKQFEKTFHKQSDVIEGLLMPKYSPNKVLHFISATRLSGEKGGKRFRKIIEALREAKIKFDWKVFTNDALPKDCPELIKCSPTMDIYDYIADADYLVQLSDSEALCCVVREALMLGTPVIVTDIPAFNYVQDGVMGYKLNLDMSNLDIQKIYNEIPNGFEYKEDNDQMLKQWCDKIGGAAYDKFKGKNGNKMVRVKALIDYNDLELNKYITAGTEMEVNELRAFALCQATASHPQVAERIK